MTPTPAGAWAAEHLPGLPLLKPEDVNEPAAIASVRALGNEARGGGARGDLAWVVIAYGQKLSRPLIDGVFAVNLHGSLLPRWRGAAPINHAILAGDAVSGNSVITIADRMDAGLVLGRSEPPVPIEPWMTAGDLHAALAADGPGVVLKVLPDRGVARACTHARGEARGQPQDESLVTRARKLSRADGWINFAAGAEACRRRVHGLTPWPGVSIQLGGTGVPPVIATNGAGVPPVGQTTIKLLRVEVTDANHEGKIGTILDPAAGLVQCGGGTALRLLEVQPAGKRAMTWSDFVHGHAVQAGAVLRSEIAAPAAPQGGTSC
jgi:methionyl-tRNA formyltransferase